jgi:hypothetical protein
MDSILLIYYYLHSENAPRRRAWCVGLSFDSIAALEDQTRLLRTVLAESETKVTSEEVGGAFLSSVV